MKTYISLLRGINVGGNKKVDMKKLQTLYESLGFRNVKTYINSGNVVFKANPEADKIKTQIEKKIKEVFKFDVTVNIRTDGELKKILEKNPFKKKDAAQQYMMFLSDEPKNYSKEELDKVKASKEEYSIIGKEIYLLFGNGYGKTKLSNAFFEKKLKVEATTRNLNTTNKLHELAQS